MFQTLSIVDDELTNGSNGSIVWKVFRCLLAAGIPVSKKNTFLSKEDLPEMIRTVQ
jgi:hypothetical protein